MRVIPDKGENLIVKGCCLGFLIIVLLAGCLGGAAVVAPKVTYNTLVAKYGNEVMTNPPAAAKTGLTFHQLLADRAQAEKERGAAYGKHCDQAFETVFYGSFWMWYVYANAATDPAGREGTWGKQISQKDWDQGFVPAGDEEDYNKALFDAMVALYWQMQVKGAYDGVNECRLRWPKPANGGAGL